MQKQRVVRAKSSFEGSHIITSLTLLGLMICFVMALREHYISVLPGAETYFIPIWLALAMCFSLISFKNFTCGFLISVFSMLIAWRIAGIYHMLSVMVPLIIVFALFLSNFIYCVHKNLKSPTRYLHPLSLFIWQLTFIRLYIGFDFIPHFTEKLFAGPVPRFADIRAFANLGITDPVFFVYLAGCCELGAAIALSLGFLTRLGSIAAVLYLLMATYLGHHFIDGFIWAGPGGGWEFAVMWIMLILSFAVTGANAFSIDQVLSDRFTLPRWIQKLM